MNVNPVSIEVRGLTSKFSNQVVHENLNLKVLRGEVLGIIGGSGVGKSVLMNTMLGLKKPNAGEVFFEGESTSFLSRSQLEMLERRRGGLFQGGALFSALSVLENVMAPIKEHVRIPNWLCVELAMSKIHLVGLDLSAASKLPAELSGGMRKRAGLARALALDPDYLFLDEPTAGLDPIGASQFDDLLSELSEVLKFTTIMITHDLDCLLKLCSRVAVLADKHVIANAPLSQIMAYKHPWIQRYFGGARGRNVFKAHNYEVG